MLATQSEDHSQSFWDRIAPKYARKPVSNPTAYEQKLAQLASLLKATDRVLEIGCGTGSTALRLAQGVLQMTATDVSRGMIEIAQAKLGPQAPANVTFYQADAKDLVDGHPFDAICAFSLLHLVADLPGTLDRVHEQLKPGGLFISKTVCLEERTILLHGFIAVLHAMGVAPKVFSLGRDGLAAQIQAAGFEVETISHFGSDRTNPFIVARRAP